jgi:hypothetical protein
MILCDTNILIEFYKNNNAVISELKKIGQPNIAVSVVTSGELIFGAINKKELHQILKDLSHLNVLSIDAGICSIFLKLMEQHSLSHKLSLPDALIAATALVHDVPLYTMNLKDFRFIPKLKLYP